MKKNKSKKSFLDIMYTFVMGFLIIFILGAIVLVWFFGMKPRSVKLWFFENYYNQTHDPRYQWTQ